MNFKRKLLIFLISFVFIIPINALAYSKYLIPGGENIGIKVESDGIYVVGFYKVNDVEIAKRAGFKLGDRIISINNSLVHSVDDLINKISSEDDYITINYGIIRNNKNENITMMLKKDSDLSYKTGIYVKDRITGIGTLTYIDPNNNSYGALGHEISESNTNIKFVIKTGNIYSSSITSITKSNKNNPGEKNAKIKMDDVYGDIKDNLDTGIFGSLTKKISSDDLIEVVSLDDVKIGKAEIITVLNGSKKEKFDIEILSIDKNHPTKNFFIKVVDEKLLEKTGGIVKGMSGSPIIQNGKLVGAITHTIVDHPDRGYGISIVKMLESVE